MFSDGVERTLRWRVRRASRRSYELDRLHLASRRLHLSPERLPDGRRRTSAAARPELDSVTIPTDTTEGLQLDGMLALSRALVAAADKRPDDVEAPLDHATEVAERTGQADAFRLGFGPVNVGLWRMASALKADEPDAAVRVAPRPAT